MVGKNFSKKFWKWFGNSVVRDENGYPLPVFHGSNSEKPFNTFKSGDGFGIHFGSLKQALGRLRDTTQKWEPRRLYTCYLRLENPLYLIDLGTWNGDDIMLSMRGLVGPEYTELRRTLREPYLKYRMGDIDCAEFTEEVKAAILKGGHDGVIYKNLFEAPVGTMARLEKISGFSGVLTDLESSREWARIVTADPYLEFSYIVFSPNQIKHWLNDSPSTSGNIYNPPR